MKEPEKFKPIDMLPMMDKLNPHQIVCLICIEQTRCHCRLKGRKWLAIMSEMVKLRIATSLLDAYCFIKRLYGVKWEEVCFDYHNAVRGKKDTLKYIETAGEFDCRLAEFIFGFSNTVEEFAEKLKNDTK